MSDFESIPGKGVRGHVKQSIVALGNRAFMDSLGVDVSGLAQRGESLRTDGKAAMFVSVNGKLGGLVAVADPVKETTPEAMDALHKAGIRIVMLTGDSETTAKAVAARLGSTKSLPGSCPIERQRSSSNFRAKVGSSRWPATVSMTLRH